MITLLVFILMISSTLENPLNGRHIKAVGAELTTVFTVEKDSNGKITGYDGPTYFLLDWLSEQLNFTYEIETLPVFEWGIKLQNGSYTGLIGHIQREESDVALGAFGAVTLEPFMEMSFPWNVYPNAILIPYPTEQSKIWAAFLPFQLHVWLGFLFSSAALTGGMAFYKLMARDTKDHPLNFGAEAMYLVGVATAQGGYLARRGRSVTLLAAIWCLSMFVLVSAYSGLLISFLSASRLVPLADSLKELARIVPAYELYTFKESNSDNIFMHAQNGDYKILGDYLRQNEANRREENEDCMEIAYRRGGFCITAWVAIDKYIAKVLKETGQCRISRSKHTYFPVQVYLLFNNNNPYHRETNRQILLATDMGLTKKWSENEIKSAKKCLERTKEAKTRPLRLKDLSSAFLILSIGAVAALVALIFELVTKKFTRK